jgi:hypothetical protein
MAVKRQKFGRVLFTKWPEKLNVFKESHDGMDSAYSVRDMKKVFSLNIYQAEGARTVTRELSQLAA